jgi:polar amino acid transport system substrate-binding protein
LLADLAVMRPLGFAEMRWRELIAGVLGLLAAPTIAPVVAGADDLSITLYFHIRPPCAQPGAPVGVKGLLVTPVIKALNEAGLDARWVEMPPARQTEEIKRATTPACGLGWFKRPEREEFAIFSAPIYKDRPSVIVTRKDDARFAAPSSLQRIFADPSLKLLVKTGYSYGAVIDGWLQAYRPATQESAGANETMLNMIANRRHDYTIMAAEEADYLLQRDAPLGAALHAIALSDAPEGEQRYLMCSRATPADAIARLNAKLVDLANW